jgi:hypothetical protein
LSEGLPVGLQFIGPAWSELELFRLARAFEGITAGDAWRSQEPSQLGLADDPTTPSPRARIAAGSAA